jgi:hypothetical protein
MLVLMAVACLLGVAGLVSAQEGHPMTGTWHGAWKASATDSKPVVFFLRWDNKNIVGEINPGRNSMPIKIATLDPAKWALHMEATAKDGSTVVIDGALENIGSYNRSLKGTWTQGAAKGALEMTRD